MKILFILNSFIFIITYFTAALAQDDLKSFEAIASIKDKKTFNLISLDKKNETIIVTPNYVNRTLKIVCKKDTVTINDFWGVPPQIQLLNKNFLELKYEVRGGSNLGLGNVLILCVNNNKLFEALHILRYTSSDYGDLKTDYHVNAKLNGRNKNNIKLHLYIHEDVASSRNTDANYVYANQAVLKFDKRKNVFYSIKENIFDHFIYSDTARIVKQKIDGNFPVIIAGKEIYYFINRKWYQLASNKEMYEFN